jgi:Ser/Thr protein kinase RdoA (MazF antagonist)
MAPGSFELLSPDAVIRSVEAAFGLTLDGTLVPYPSYINRVYGLRTDDGRELVAKFYRPGRWEASAIQEEHRFILDCAEEEIPVVSPMDDLDGDTLAETTLVESGEEHDFLFALFPKRGGRNFDAESDEDWTRLGSIAGRLHAAGSKRPSPSRPVCLPDRLTAVFVEELVSGGVIHPECLEEFREVCGAALALVDPLFRDVPLVRAHGDLHRGNILDRPGEGLLLIDFDDMMTAPAVQDLWLLLPGRADECSRELEMLIDGYEAFRPFDRRTIRLIEPLRFMRMVYYLAWQARQRDDRRFRIDYPDWGGKAFWEKEIEDLRDQSAVLLDSLS